jgi:hypothetical protein
VYVYVSSSPAKELVKSVLVRADSDRECTAPEWYWKSVWSFESDTHSAEAEAGIGAAGELSAYGAESFWSCLWAACIETSCMSPMPPMVSMGSASSPPMPPMSKLNTRSVLIAITLKLLLLSPLCLCVCPDCPDCPVDHATPCSLSTLLMRYLLRGTSSVRLGCVGCFTETEGGLNFLLGLSFLEGALPKEEEGEREHRGIKDTYLVCKYVKKTVL